MSFSVKVSSLLRDTIRKVEDWHFDRTRGVSTAGDTVPHRATDVVGPQRDGYVYLPARVRNVKAALAELPRDLASFTFIDIGSGKGRVVLLAAEHPFKEVLGVEYSQALHREAQKNVTRFEASGRAKAPMDVLLADAATYCFPAGNLVLYLFNPFGPEILTRMLANLQTALAEQPREVFLILLWPELSHLVASQPYVTLHRRTPRFEIFHADLR